MHMITDASRGGIAVTRKTTMFRPTGFFVTSMLFPTAVSFVTSMFLPTGFFVTLIFFPTFPFLTSMFLPACTAVLFLASTFLPVPFSSNFDVPSYCFFRNFDVHLTAFFSTCSLGFGKKEASRGASPRWCLMRSQSWTLTPRQTCSRTSWWWEVRLGSMVSETGWRKTLR